MQVDKQYQNEHVISPKLKDGTTYLILFIASILFTSLVIQIFVTPIYLAMPTKFHELYLAYIAGSKAHSYAYQLIMQLSSVVAQDVAYIFFLCVIAVICRRMLILEFGEFKAKLGKNLLMILAFGVVIYIADVVVSFIYQTLGIGGTSINQLIIYGMLNSTAMWPTIILTIFLAPVVEELIYRKFMISFLNKSLHLNIWVAGLISAAIFSLIHVTNSIDDLVYFPQYFAMALVLVGAYVYSKENIYFSIGVHIFNNAISVVLWAISTLM